MWKTRMKKLELNGIRGNAVSLIKTYLTDRQQTVDLNVNISPPVSNSTGEPQVRKFGRLLFILYINDLYYKLNTGQNNLVG